MAFKTKCLFRIEIERNDEKLPRLLLIETLRNEENCRLEKSFEKKDYLNNTLSRLPDFQIDSGIHCFQRGSVLPPEGLGIISITKN